MPTVVQNTIADRTDGKPIALLENVQAPNTGSWKPLNGVRPLSIVLRGNFVATCKVFIANDPLKPDDADNNYPQLGTDKTAPALVSLADVGVQWVKVQVSAYTSGAVYAFALVG